MFRSNKISSNVSGNAPPDQQGYADTIISVTDSAKHRENSTNSSLSPSANYAQTNPFNEDYDGGNSSTYNDDSTNANTKDIKQHETTDVIRKVLTKDSVLCDEHSSCIPGSFPLDPHWEPSHNYRVTLPSVALDKSAADRNTTSQLTAPQRGPRDQRNGNSGRTVVLPSVVTALPPATIALSPITSTARTVSPTVQHDNTKRSSYPESIITTLTGKGADHNEGHLVQSPQQQPLPRAFYPSSSQSSSSTSIGSLVDEKSRHGIGASWYSIAHTR